jgi:hypothetical protein
MPVKTAFRVMDSNNNRTTTTSVELTAARELRRRLEQIGPSDCVARFLHTYAKVRVQSLYALHLCLYFRWLRKARGVQMTPDELIVDNLPRCHLESVVVHTYDEFEDFAQSFGFQL